VTVVECPSTGVGNLLQRFLSLVGGNMQSAVLRYRLVPSQAGEGKASATLGSDAMVLLPLEVAYSRGVSTTEASWWVPMVPPQKAVGYTVDRSARYTLGGGVGGEGSIGCRMRFRSVVECPPSNKASPSPRSHSVLRHRQCDRFRLTREPPPWGLVPTWSIDGPRDYVHRSKDANR
jgi:hypothetical protein